MEIGNQTQNHKIDTNSELIYEDVSIWSTLIFIKIIGSDTLWFPLPPSEVLCIFHCENTHKVWYKNLWNWHGNRNLMIYDLWPYPKVTSLTLGWKFYLHSVLLVILVNLICHIIMFENYFFWPPEHPQRPKVPPLGHDPGYIMKIPSDMFCIFHLWEYTQSLE